MQPAIVKFIGNKINNDYNGQFTVGKEYEAFFVEYWQGVRNSLHVRNNFGDIVDFIPFDEFSVVSDPDNMLTMDEAIVRCITEEHNEGLSYLYYGHEYRVVGMDIDGYYLVMDESYDCYFYPKTAFEIVDDPHGLLSRVSVYYSYMSGNIIDDTR